MQPDEIIVNDWPVDNEWEKLHFWLHYSEKPDNKSILGNRKNFLSLHEHHRRALSAALCYNQSTLLPTGSYLLSSPDTHSLPSKFQKLLRCHPGRSFSSITCVVIRSVGLMMGHTLFFSPARMAFIQSQCAVQFKYTAVTIVLRGKLLGLRRWRSICIRL